MAWLGVSWAARGFHCCGFSLGMLALELAAFLGRETARWEGGRWPWVKIQIVAPVNIRLNATTKIGFNTGGAWIVTVDGCEIHVTVQTSWFLMIPL